MANHLKTIEKNLRPARLDRVLVCDELDYTWDRPELRLLAKMWKDGISVKTMAEHFSRDPDEVLIALIHLARKFDIKPRKKGLG